MIFMFLQCVSTVIIVYIIISPLNSFFIYIGYWTLNKYFYCSNPYVNSVSAPQPSRLLSIGMQYLKRVYNWSKHFCPVISYFIGEVQ